MYSQQNTLLQAVTLLAKLEPNYLLLNHLIPNCSLNLENHCLAQIKVKLYTKLSNSLYKYSNPAVYALLWMILGMKYTTKVKLMISIPYHLPNLHLHILRCLYTTYTQMHCLQNVTVNATNYGYKLKNGSLVPIYHQNNDS